MLEILRRLIRSSTNLRPLPQQQLVKKGERYKMDPIMAALIAEGIKTLLPAVISYMHQSGMTEAEVNAAWQTAYTRFKTEDPNLLPTA